MSSLVYPFPEVPAAGVAREVAPGIRWLSMPLPFKLDHINLWLLEDDGGTTIVDTGIGNAETRALWEKLFPSIGRVKRVIVTHYHPDHAGNAAWLCQRHGVELWMTQGEYLTAHAVRSSGAGYTTDAVVNVFRRNGLDEERSGRLSATRGNNRYAEMVPEFPVSYRRIIEGDRVAIDGVAWEAIIGHGHAPEHLSLYARERNVVIAGDMLLSPSPPMSASGRSTRRATRCACSSSRWSATARCPPTCWCCPRTASRFTGRTCASSSCSSITRRALRSCCSRSARPRARRNS